MKNMQIQFVQIILIFFSITIYAQDGSNVNIINKNLNNSNYIFEGKIESVEFYTVDNKGNRMPNSSAKWENSVGNFYNEDGSDAQSFSMAKIKLTWLSAIIL